MTTNKQAQAKIINALSDLYFIKLKTPGLTAQQKSDVQTSIDGLEAEFAALRGLGSTTSYASVTALFRDAKAELKSVIAERARLANTFLSAAKILGSIRSVLGLLD